VQRARAAVDPLHARRLHEDAGLGLSPASLVDRTRAWRAPRRAWISWRPTSCAGADTAARAVIVDRPGPARHTRGAVDRRRAQRPHPQLVVHGAAISVRARRYVVATAAMLSGTDVRVASGDGHTRDAPGTIAADRS
jgi:hypothetical protein